MFRADEQLAPPRRTVVQKGTELEAARRGNDSTGEGARATEKAHPRIHHSGSNAETHPEYVHRPASSQTVEGD